MGAPTLYQQPQNGLEVRYNIIYHYFKVWSQRVVQKIQLEGWEEKFALVDLCAGEGTSDTQMGISAHLLQEVTQKKATRSLLSAIINDHSETAIAQLTGEIAAINQIENLTFPPQLNLSSVDQAVKKALLAIRALPTFALLEFWQYEGLTWDWLQSFLLQGKADSLLLMDIRAALAALRKKKTPEALVRLLGASKIAQLKEQFKHRLSYPQKEQLLKKAIEQQLQQYLGTKIQRLCFTFYDEKSKLHQCLYFLTPNPAAYDLMREIFCSHSQIIEDGIGNLSYHPLKGPQRHVSGQTLFNPMFQLEQELLRTYKSQTLQFIDIYEQHHKGKALIKKNYVDALLNLERKNKITVTRKRVAYLPKQQGISDKVFVSFNK